MPERPPSPRLRVLPKTDLHLHALGALRPTTVLDLARRRGAPILPVGEAGAAEGGYRFEDLSAFVAFFLGLFELALDAPALERITFEVLEDAAAEGCRYAELRFTPTSHLDRGAEEQAFFAGIEAGRRAAEEACAIEARLVLDFPRTRGPEVAEKTLHLALRHRAEGVVGLDVAGDERATGFDPCFVPVSEEARRRGLIVTAHAGEGAGPESVRAAVEAYGARRIGHGTRAAEDPSLLDLLARRGVVLEVCPSSNVALGVVDALAHHPLPRFLRAGVVCTIATDDPALFSTTLTREYERLHDEAGMGWAALGRLAAAGFAAAARDLDRSEGALAARLDAWEAQARAWARAWAREEGPSPPVPGGESRP
ncbi:MAG: adenosine deaminase [Planctomycetota bacterium]